MKKSLLTCLVAAGISLHSLAEPAKLHSLLTEKGSDRKINSETNTHYNGHFEVVSTNVIENLTNSRETHTNNYRVKALAGTRTETKSDQLTGTTNKLLSFSVSGNKTEFQMNDRGANGLGSDNSIGSDSFIFKHKFDSGEEMHLSIIYYRKDEFGIDLSIIMNGNGKDIHTGGYTKDLNPVMHYIVKRKLSPIVDWSRSFYADMVNTTFEGRAYSFPYQNIDESLKELEANFVEFKKGRKKPEELVRKLCTKYIEAAQKHRKK